MSAQSRRVLLFYRPISLEQIREINQLGTRDQRDLERYQATQRLIGIKQSEVDGLPVFLPDRKNKKTMFQCSYVWAIAS
jgi:hypothetical protein